MIIENPEYREETTQKNTGTGTCFTCLGAVCGQLKGLTIIKQKLVAWHFAGPLFFCNFAATFNFRLSQ